MTSLSNMCTLYYFSKTIYLTSNARVTATLSPMTSTDRTRRLLLIGPTSVATRVVWAKGSNVCR